MDTAKVRAVHVLWELTGLLENNAGTLTRAEWKKVLHVLWKLVKLADKQVRRLPYAAK
jgi:hypothetical protein